MTLSSDPRRASMAAVGGLALMLWAVALRASFPGYDTMWSLVWGDQLAHGQIPRLAAGVAAPTPHPLAIVVAAALTLLGPATATAVTMLSAVALAALAWTAYRLAALLFSPMVGVLFAVILTSRPQLLFESLQVIVDIPFLALLLAAGGVELRRPLAGAPVLALLALAGLLRPEAWVLSLVYAGYLVARSGRLRPVVALALAAPCLWAAFDLVSTGDPLFSLHTTRDLAARIDRPRGGATALAVVPGHLESILGTSIVWLGLVGGLALVVRFPARALAPVGVLGLGIAAFVGLASAGLPALARYLLVPATMLALLCAASLGGWLSLERGGRLRRIWAAAAVVGLVVLSVGARDDAVRLGHVVAANHERQAAESRLAASLRRSSTRSWIRDCGRVEVDDPRLVPLVAYSAGIDPDRIDLGGSDAPGAVAIARSRELTERARRSGRRLGDGTWTLLSRCESPLPARGVR